MLAAYRRAAASATCASSSPAASLRRAAAGRGGSPTPSAAELRGERCRNGFFAAAGNVLRRPEGRQRAPPSPAGGTTSSRSFVRPWAAADRGGGRRGGDRMRGGERWPTACFSTSPGDERGGKEEAFMVVPPPPSPALLAIRTAPFVPRERGRGDAAELRRMECARRALHALAATRREADAARRRSEQVRSVQSRGFATGGGPSPPDDDGGGGKPPPSASEKERGGGDDARVRQQRTDADFARYLSGKADDGGGGGEAAAAPAAAASNATAPPPSPPPPDEWRHLHKEHPDLSLPSPRERNEARRRIERNRRTNLEESRARTSAAVRRALGGNLVICAAKFGAWLSSGSSALLSEFIHSVVDCGNQSLLLLGLRDSRWEADRRHPYGYGKSVYFWALVSALGSFFLGAGVSMTHAVGELIEGPSLQEVTPEVWAVLGLSFAVDGYVLWKTVAGLWEEAPEGTPFYTYVKNLRDPATLAILLEDGAACLGVVIAIAGIGATSATGQPVFDGLAGVTISGLLAAMGLALARVNHRFLLGQAVDPETTRGIERILLGRSSIENVHSVQSQWTGPETFSYKAEVDFDGTFLAARIMPRYQREFLEARDTLDDSDLRVLLSWYAEDVMRTVEREVRDIEAEIREAYPGAEFIELEPMSKDSDRFAIDDGMEAQLKRIEMEALNRFLKSMYKSKAASRGTAADAKPPGKRPSASSEGADNNVCPDKDVEKKDGRKTS